MNSNVLFLAIGGKEWIGGVYYVKNMLYSFLQNENAINSSSKIFVLTTEENKYIFKCFEKQNVEILIYRNNRFNNLVRRISNRLIKKTIDVEIIIRVLLCDIKHIFPVSSYPLAAMKKKSIFWIPDFQHVYLPQMFSIEEIKYRDRLFSYLAKEHKKLVLSSDDAYNQYKELYPNYSQGVYVIPFVSYIEDEIKGINEKFISDTIEKYNLNREFIFSPNQFWKHKNHKILFEAIAKIEREYDKNVLLLCTGSTNDYRNKDYFKELTDYINENNLQNNICILGFISRREQLVLMMLSKIIVQPSLFEGWGTTVEDAKALNKDLILSDIDVHFEQANDNCVFFNRNDYEELAKKIYNKLRDSRSVTYDRDLHYIKTISKDYSNKFVELLKE